MLKPLAFVLTPLPIFLSLSLAHSNTGRNGDELAPTTSRPASKPSQVPHSTEGGCLFAIMFAEVLGDAQVQQNMAAARDQQPAKDIADRSANSASVDTDSDTDVSQKTP